MRNGRLKVLLRLLGLPTAQLVARPLQPPSPPPPTKPDFYPQSQGFFLRLSG